MTFLAIWDVAPSRNHVFFPVFCQSAAERTTLVVWPVPVIEQGGLLGPWPWHRIAGQAQRLRKPCKNEQQPLRPCQPFFHSLGTVFSSCSCAEGFHVGQSGKRGRTGGNELSQASPWMSGWVKVRAQLAQQIECLSRTERDHPGTSDFLLVCNYASEEIVTQKSTLVFSGSYN